jgi:hypothetical protein
LASPAAAPLALHLKSILQAVKTLQAVQLTSCNCTQEIQKACPRAKATFESDTRVLVPVAFSLTLTIFSGCDPSLQVISNDAVATEALGQLGQIVLYPPLAFLKHSLPFKFQARWIASLLRGVRALFADLALCCERRLWDDPSLPVISINTTAIVVFGQLTIGTEAQQFS